MSTTSLSAQRCGPTMQRTAEQIWIKDCTKPQHVCLCFKPSGRSILHLWLHFLHWSWSELFDCSSWCITPRCGDWQNTFVYVGARELEHKIKHPQSLMFPPTCFTVGILRNSFFLLRPWWVKFIAKKFNVCLLWWICNNSSVLHKK